MPHPSNHVYFVHGIGKHGKEWLDEADDGTTPREQLADAWKRYGKSLGKMEDHLRLVPICYDNVYTDLYAAWSEAVATLRTHLVGHPGAADTLKPLLDAAERPANGVANDEFLFTHVFDLLWYWGNSLVQGKIVSSVARQILDDLVNYYEKPGNSFSIVAHSMGTSVVHKVLQALYTEPQYRDRLSSRLKFKVVMQISNTSYALSANRDSHYTNVVKPSAYANAGVCWTMINVACRYDPVSELIPFDPPADWLDSYSQSSGSYLAVRTARIATPNVHSIARYIENPLVHIPLFERLRGVTIPAPLKKKAFEEFDARTPEGAFKQVKGQFENLINSSGTSTPEFIAAVKQFMDLVRTFGSAVP